ARGHLDGDPARSHHALCPQRLAVPAREVARHPGGGGSARTLRKDMTFSALPFRSSLTAYEQQADDLLAAWRAADPEALRVFREHHPRFLDERIPSLPMASRTGASGRRRMRCVSHGNYSMRAPTRMRWPGCTAANTRP